jgi:16S rRNA U516 pseudouridylate synthase RsuA-like enzyme
MAGNAEPKRRMVESFRKSRYLTLMVTDADRKLFNRASEIAHPTFSEWARDTLREAANREIRRASQAAGQPPGSLFGPGGPRPEPPPAPPAV